MQLLQQQKIEAACIYIFAIAMVEIIKQLKK